MEKKFGNSKLQELINKLCPDGVEYRLLNEISNIHAGDRIIKSEMEDNGYPVWGGGFIPTGYFVKYNELKGIAISRAGSAGSVNWIDSKFWATDVCFVVSDVDNNLLLKFVFYYIKSQEFELKRHIYGGNLPKLNKDYLWSLQIPIPPMPVQEEIVRILDKFTELETELETELTLRKQQYEYYRDNLLDFEMFSKENIKDLSLSSLTDIQKFVWELVQKYCPDGMEYDKIFVLAEVGTGRTDRKDASENGLYPFYVRSKDVLASDNYLYDEEAIIIPGEGSVGDIFHYVDGKYDLHQRAYRVHFFDKNVNTKYAYYYFSSMFKYYIYKHSVEATVTSIRKPMIEQFQIPVPPKPMQEEIVKILDKFSDLTTDIQKGLPAEIEMRRKQYEYYRDKLLSFDRANGQ